MAKNSKKAVKKSTKEIIEEILKNKNNKLKNVQELKKKENLRKQIDRNEGTLKQI